MNYLVVGAGLSGAIIANKLAASGEHRITVIDKRDHLGGNCYTYTDAETGVTVHKYGAHVFNSPSQKPIDFFNRYLDMHSYIHRVRAILPGKSVYSMPINLHTINQFFGQTLNPIEAKAYLSKLKVNIENPQNFEEQALSMIGKELYEAFFKGYTIKQWGVDPKELPASILKRLPVRFDYNDNYYHSSYLGMPANGYTPLFESLFSKGSLNVHLNTSYDPALLDRYDHIFFSGPIDSFFDYRHGRLGYRTVYWKNEIYNGDFQGNSVNNYPHQAVPYTRIVEHKHFTPWKDFDKSFVSFEYSKETGKDDIPYYPTRLSEDIRKLKIYIRDAMSIKNVSFIGRLGTYRYLDMWKVTEETVDFASTVLNCISENKPLPKFSGDPINA